ncbi:MAG: hypothetical protein ABIQ01_05745 [Pseudolysinimonas sp.]
MIAVFHVQGFADEGKVREIHVAQHSAESVVDVAKGVIDQATAGEHTELVSFRRTWPLDGYGQEWAVVQVDAVTKTTLDGGASWSEMWHWFGTLSSPWPLAGSVPDTPEKACEHAWSVTSDRGDPCLLGCGATRQ